MRQLARYLLRYPDDVANETKDGVANEAKDDASTCHNLAGLPVVNSLEVDSDIQTLYSLLEPGDHIYTQTSPGVNHHVIVLPEKEIIHITNRKKEIVDVSLSNSIKRRLPGLIKIAISTKEMIIKKGQLNFLKKSPNVLYKIEYKNPQPISEIVERANELNGKLVKYNALTQNCEHIATYIATGKYRSLQSEYVLKANFLKDPSWITAFPNKIYDFQQSFLQNSSTPHHEKKAFNGEQRKISKSGCICKESGCAGVLGMTTPYCYIEPSEKLKCRDRRWDYCVTSKPPQLAKLFKDKWKKN